MKSQNLVDQLDFLLILFDLVTGFKFNHIKY